MPASAAVHAHIWVTLKAFFLVSTKRKYATVTLKKKGDKKRFQVSLPPAW